MVGTIQRKPRDLDDFFIVGIEAFTADFPWRVDFTTIKRGVTSSRQARGSAKRKVVYPTRVYQNKR